MCLALTLTSTDVFQSSGNAVRSIAQSRTGVLSPCWGEEIVISTNCDRVGRAILELKYGFTVAPNTLCPNRWQGKVWQATTSSRRRT